MLIFGTRWRWVVSFTSRPLYPLCNTIQQSLNKKLGGFHSRCGLWRENNISCTVMHQTKALRWYSPFLSPYSDYDIPTPRPTHSSILIHSVLLSRPLRSTLCCFSRSSDAANYRWPIFRWYGDGQNNIIMGCGVPPSQPGSHESCARRTGSSSGPRKTSQPWRHSLPTVHRINHTGSSKTL